MTNKEKKEKGPKKNQVSVPMGKGYLAGRKRLVKNALGALENMHRDFHLLWNEHKTMVSGAYAQPRQPKGVFFDAAYETSKRSLQRLGEGFGMTFERYEEDV